MPRPEQMEGRRPVRRSEIVRDLARLGVRPGVPTMVHASLSSLGWVVGGTQTLVEALLSVVGPDGTLCAQASWEDIPFGLASWPEAWRAAYRAEMPAFDPRRSAAAPYEGRLAERLRTWPGARRSAHPATGVVAVGAAAEWLTSAHPLDDGFGPGTPYERIVLGGGQVLLLGAPLWTISLLHHAESLARAPKRWTTLHVPLQDAWHALREIDVWSGAFPYEQALERGVPPLEQIARSALGAGIGGRGTVGTAECHLLPARALVAHAIEWLESRFG